MNDYGQMAFREDYRRGLARLRKRLSEKHSKHQVRCIFDEARTSIEWILRQPGTQTAVLEQYELDALILFRRYLKEGKCQI